MALTKAYDAIFREHGSGLPVWYLRSLANWESSFRPGCKTGEAWGLLQVVPDVVKDFNDAHPDEHYSHQDMLDAAKCVRVAAWRIDSFRRVYDRRFAGHPHIVTNWDDEEFLAILTHAWNAGYSMVAGVGYVAEWQIEKHPSEPVTIESIGRYAADAPNTYHTLLGTTGRKKREWAIKVAITAMAEKKSDAGEGEDSSSRRPCSFFHWLRYCRRGLPIPAAGDDGDDGS